MATTFNQPHFRIRNDDGSQTSATWKAATDAASSLLVDTTYRLRIAVNQTDASAGSLAPSLYCSKNAGAFAVVNGASSNARLHAFATVTDDATTTQQISNGSFTAGREDSNGTITSIGPISQNYTTEIEWCFQIRSADVANGDTLQFKVYNSGVALNGIANVVVVAVAINLTSYELIATGDTRVAAQLTTDQGQVASDLAGQLGKVANGQTLSVLGQTSGAGTAPAGGGTSVIGSGIITPVRRTGMSYKVGDSYVAEFTTQRFDTGAATDADSLPVATANKNGVDDGGFALTVTKLDTGRYKVTGTIPAGYTTGTVVNCSVAATVNSVAGKAVIDSFVCDSKRISDLNDIAAAGLATSADIATLGSPMQAGALALSSDERNAIADALLARANAIDGKTVQQAIRYMAAVLAGKIPTGAGTSSEVYLGLDGVTPRVQVVADLQGNRTSVVYDPQP